MEVGWEKPGERLLTATEEWSVGRWQQIQLAVAVRSLLIFEIYRGVLLRAKSVALSQYVSHYGQALRIIT